MRKQMQNRELNLNKIKILKIKTEQKNWRDHEENNFFAFFRRDFYSFDFT